MALVAKHISCILQKLILPNAFVWLRGWDLYTFKIAVWLGRCYVERVRGRGCSLNTSSSESSRKKRFGFSSAQISAVSYYLIPNSVTQPTHCIWSRTVLHENVVTSPTHCWCLFGQEIWVWRRGKSKTMCIPTMSRKVSSCYSTSCWGTHTFHSIFGFNSGSY